MGDYWSEMDRELKWSMDAESADPADGADHALENERPQNQWVAKPSKGRGIAKDVRLAKVLRLRAALAKGTYHVSVYQLADSMIRSARGEVTAFRRM